MKRIIVLLSLLFFVQNIFAEKPFQRFSALPFLAYSEETKLQYGGMFLLFFKHII